VEAFAQSGNQRRQFGPPTGVGLAFDHRALEAAGHHSGTMQAEVNEKRGEYDERDENCCAAGLDNVHKFSTSGRRNAAA